MDSYRSQDRMQMMSAVKIITTVLTVCQNLLSPAHTHLLIHLFSFQINRKGKRKPKLH